MPKKTSFESPFQPPLELIRLFVDYDGKKAFDDYKNNKPQITSDELEFVKRNSSVK